MMVTLQLAKTRPHRRRSAAERGRRRSFCLARNSPQGQGKKIGDNLCGRDDSCDQHVMQLRQREKCGGREGNWVNSRPRSGGVRCLLCPLAPIRTRTRQSFFWPCLTCRDGWFPWQRDVCCLEERQGDRRSIDNLFGSPGFRREPLRQTDNLGSAHHDHH